MSKCFLVFKFCMITYTCNIISGDVGFDHKMDYYIFVNIIKIFTKDEFIQTLFLRPICPNN